MIKILQNRSKNAFEAKGRLYTTGMVNQLVFHIDMLMLVLTSLVSAGLKKAVDNFYFHDTPATYFSNTCIRSYLRQLAIG